MNEMLLIKQASAGDKEAFSTLYGRYKDRLYRYAFYKTGQPSAAEDAVSECVLSAWKGIGGLRSPEAFSSWIFRILNACCARQIHEVIEKRKTFESLRDVSRETQTELSSALELSEALSQLNEEDQEIVLLSVIGGMTSSEIGSLKDMPSGTIRSRLSRGLAKMRSFLEEK